MRGILGVAEPKKLGGQWRVNQKRWPKFWFLLHQGDFAFPGGQCSGLLCSSSGFPNWPLICFLLGRQVLLQSHRGRMCVCSTWTPLTPLASCWGAFSDPGELGI